MVEPVHQSRFPEYDVMHGKDELLRQSKSGFWVIPAAIISALVILAIIFIASSFLASSSIVYFMALEYLPFIMLAVYLLGGWCFIRWVRQFNLSDEILEIKWDIPAHVYLGLKVGIITGLIALITLLPDYIDLLTWENETKNLSSDELDFEYSKIISNGTFGISLEYFILVFITVGIIGPIIEEWVFRGWLLPTLISIGRRPKTAIAISGIVFGFIHFQGLINMLLLSIVGMALAWLRLKTGSLAAPIIAHIAHNILVLVPPALLMLVV